MRKPLNAAVALGWRVGVLLAMGLLTACSPQIKESAAPAESVQLRAAVFGDLPDWTRDRHDAALVAFRKSCPALLAGGTRNVGGRTVLSKDWASPCAAAEKVPAGMPALARAYFEHWFQPFLVTAGVASEGLFTGYFEAELKGSPTRTERFNVPLFGVPRDLVSVDLGRFDANLQGRSIVGRVAKGRVVPYHRRGDIERGALGADTPILAWTDDAVDAFLLHVQGSGRVVMTDGSVLRIGYAANNGHGYVSIGRHLIERGELRRGRAGWQAIRDWISRNPEQADALLAENPRYIFFRTIDGEGPIGAQGVALTPRRSLAVDPRYIPLGAPLWLDTVWPGGGARPLRRLMVAQDTGSAIKGPIRGDFFWGYGADALAEAGRMKSRGRYYLLLPRSSAPPIS